MFAGFQALVSEKAVRETPILEVAGSKPICSKVLLIRGLFLYFIFHFIKLLFFPVLAIACEAQLRFGVKSFCSNIFCDDDDHDDDTGMCVPL